MRFFKNTHIKHGDWFIAKEISDNRYRVICAIGRFKKTMEYSPIMNEEILFDTFNGMHEIIEISEEEARMWMI